MSGLIETIRQRLTGRELHQTIAIYPPTGERRDLLEREWYRLIQKPEHLFAGADLIDSVTSLIHLLGGVRMRPQRKIVEYHSSPFYDVERDATVSFKHSTIVGGHQAGQYIEIQVASPDVSQTLKYGALHSVADWEFGPTLYSEIRALGSMRPDSLQFRSYISGASEPLFPDGLVKDQRYLPMHRTLAFMTRTADLYEMRGCHMKDIQKA